MAETAGYFTDHLVRAAISTPKMTDRSDANFEKICDYTIQGLDKGLNADEKIDFLKKLDSLQNKSFIFGYYVSVGNANDLYPSYAVLSGKNFWMKLGGSLKKLFSLPKDRKQLKDQEFLEDDIRNELLEMIETSIEDGLDAGKLNDMARKGVDAYCTVIEIKLIHLQDRKYSLEFLYS